MGDDGIVGAILIKQDLKKLTERLEQLNKQNSVLQERLYWLTIVTTILAFVQTIVILTQIFN